MTRPKPTRVLSVTLNFNKPDMTVSAIEHLLLGAITPDTVLVIDNGSNPDLFEELKLKLAHLNVRLERLDKNVGIPAALNIGFRYAIDQDFDFILVVHNDVSVSANTLEVLLGEFESEANIAAVDARQMTPGQKQKIVYDGGYLIKPGLIPRTKAESINSRIYDLVTTKRLNYVEFSAALIGVNALKNVGLLDDQLFITWEDSEWSIRASIMGWKIRHSKEALVEHTPGQTIGTGKSKQYFTYALRNHLNIVRKYGSKFDLLISFLFWQLVSLRNIIGVNKKLGCWLLQLTWREFGKQTLI